MEAGEDRRDRVTGGGVGGTAAGRADGPEADDDELLIDAIERDDAVAFERFFERHRRSVLAVCRRLLEPADAEDAMQQTFLAAYVAIARRGERPTHARSWLRAIARNECLSHLRRRRASAPIEDEVIDPGSAADDVAMQQAEIRRMVEDMGRLPADQRAALVHSELDELPHREIAEGLDCRPGKVKALVFQARTTLAGLRDAREVPCERIREQVARARVGRPPAGITRHLQTCPACAEYARDMRQRGRGAVLLLPFGVALEWGRSLLGAGSAGANSAALAGGAAGGASGGGALGAGLAKLGILVAVGGAAAGAGVGDLGGLGDPARPDASIAAPRESDPEAVAGAADPAARGGESPRTESASVAHPAQDRARRSAGAKQGRGGSAGGGGSAGSPPGKTVATEAKASAPGASGAASRPAPSGPKPGKVPGPPPAAGPAGSGSSASVASDSRVPEPPGSARPPGVGDLPLPPQGCPVPASAPVC